MQTDVKLHRHPELSSFDTTLYSYGIVHGV